MGLLGSFLDLLFPPRCVFCRKLVKNGGDLICPDCRETLPFTSDGGAQHGDFFSVCVAPLYYEGNVRESLLRYKFRDAWGYADAYGKLLAACIRDELAERYDLVSWVPLSKKRLRERGYDQALLLAKAAALELGEDVIGTLEKTANVEKQSLAGSAEKRRANISGAYRAADPALVRGKRVLLVDDIVTTGATLSECARTLKTAGAAEVLCAALARSKD